MRALLLETVDDVVDELGMLDDTLPALGLHHRHQVLADVVGGPRLQLLRSVLPAKEQQSHGVLHTDQAGQLAQSQLADGLKSNKRKLQQMQIIIKNNELTMYIRVKSMTHF